MLGEKAFMICATTSLNSQRFIILLSLLDYHEILHAHDPHRMNPILSSVTLGHFCGLGGNFQASRGSAIKFETTMTVLLTLLICDTFGFPLLFNI